MTTLDEARAELKAIRELVCNAAPLTWVASQDMAGAQVWERQAAALLGIADRQERLRCSGCTDLRCTDCDSCPATGYPCERDECSTEYCELKQNPGPRR